MTRTRYNPFGMFSIFNCTFPFVVGYHFDEINCDCILYNSMFTSFFVKGTVISNKPFVGLGYAVIFSTKSISFEKTPSQSPELVSKSAETNKPDEIESLSRKEQRKKRREIRSEVSSDVRTTPSQQAEVLDKIVNTVDSSSRNTLRKPQNDALYVLRKLV